MNIEPSTTARGMQKTKENIMSDIEFIETAAETLAASYYVNIQ